MRLASEKHQYVKEMEVIEEAKEEGSPKKPILPLKVIKQGSDRSMFSHALSALDN